MLIEELLPNSKGKFSPSAPHPCDALPVTLQMMRLTWAAYTKLGTCWAVSRETDSKFSVLMGVTDSRGER